MMHFLESIPNSIIWWLYPLVSIFLLIFPRKLLHQMNPKALMKEPPPLDPYVYSFMTKKDAEVLHRIVQNLIHKNAIEFQFSDSKKIGIKKTKVEEQIIKNFHPLETYVYNKLKTEYVDYLDFLKDYGFSLERFNEDIFERYKRNWIQSAMLFPKKRLKIQNVMYVTICIMVFIFSIPVSMSREESKMGVAIIVELSFIFIGMFIIQAAVYHPRLTPKCRKYIKKEKLRLKTKKRTLREDFIYASLEPEFHLSDKIKEFRKCAEIQRPFPIAVNTDKKDLDDTLIGISVSSCNSCSCDSCSCS